MFSSQYQRFAAGSMFSPCHYFKKRNDFFRTAGGFSFSHRGRARSWVRGRRCFRSQVQVRAAGHNHLIIVIFVLLISTLGYLVRPMELLYGTVYFMSCFAFVVIQYLSNFVHLYSVLHVVLGEQMKLSCAVKAITLSALLLQITKRFLKIKLFRPNNLHYYNMC